MGPRLQGALTRTVNKRNVKAYGLLMLLVAGLGGLLYGIDVGIIAAALLYLGKTVSLTVQQTSLVVAAVMAGSTLSSLLGGLLADWIGRKKMMSISGLLFVVSVVILFTSQGFVPLMLGRLLQGISGGVIAVVVPLYLAECLDAKNRGKGSAVFQFMLTLGIVVAALTGLWFTTHAEAAIAAAAGNPVAIRAAEDHAWRGMFLSVIYPGLLFFGGSFFLSESPRWLFKRGRLSEARAALLRSSSEAEADLQMREMEQIAAESKPSGTLGRVKDSLLRRKYVLPFVLACIVLACNQATGINSILPYLVLILRQAGMSAAHATRGDLAVKALNCAMTVVAIVLIDRRGRKFLLTVGTAGIIVALSSAAILFRHIEAQRTDVTASLQANVKDNALQLDARQYAATGGAPQVLTVLYSYGAGDHVATSISDEKDPTAWIRPESASSKPLTIERALVGAVPPASSGWWMTGFLSLFIACFAAGPGVVVWLALSELMPTRIRSAGMGIALLINQGVSTVIAGVFLPVVGRYGYSVMFAFWALCTVIYFVTAAFFLPETKGKTLEEIERVFEGAPSTA
jgi:MFS transporter, SP family, solute carrier family 2 (myo-inositol transporter), member 13